MSVLLDVARGAAGVNVLLLLALGYVWLGNYRRHGAAHTLGLLVFAGLLLGQNLLWIVLYVFHPDFVAWFVHAGTDVQVGMTMLCALESAALVFLTRITWR